MCNFFISEKTLVYGIHIVVVLSFHAILLFSRRSLSHCIFGQISTRLYKYVAKPSTRSQPRPDVIISSTQQSYIFSIRLLFFILFLPFWRMERSTDTNDPARRQPSAPSNQSCVDTPSLSSHLLQRLSISLDKLYI